MRKSSKPKYPQLTDTSWLRSKLENNTQRDIAMELGCGVDTVNKWVKKHGLAPKKKAGFTKEQLESMLKKFSLAEIGERYGITKQGVRMRAKALGVDTSRDISHPLRNKKLFENLHLKRGLSFSEMARLYDTDVAFVCAIAKSLNIKCQTRSEKKDIDFERVRLLYEEGHSPATISKMTGYHSSLIRRRLKREGVKIRSYHEAVSGRTITDELLKGAVRENKTIRQLADDTGFSVRRIRDSYRKSDIEPYSKNVGFPENVTKAQLYDLYWIQKKSALTIAEDLNCSVNAVYAAMIKFNVKARSLSEASRRSSKYSELNDPLWLRNCYEVEQLSMSEISDIVGCPLGMVAYYIKKYDIKPRTKFEVNLLLDRKLTQMFGDVPISFFGLRSSYVSKKGGDVSGTQVELQYAKKLDDDEDVLSFFKEYPIKYEDLRGKEKTYRADYFVNRKDGYEVVEVKLEKEVNSAPETRRKVIQQVRSGLDYSKRTGTKFTLSTGHNPQGLLDSLTDLDLYYSCSYFDVFNEVELVDFLCKIGFQNIKLNRSGLQNALRKLKSVKPSLNSNHSCRAGLWFMRHFHPHYFESYHKDYLSIKESFGKRDLLEAVISKAYASQTRSSFDIFNLIDNIIKYGINVKPPSLFKPWVASFIYDKYLPDRGLIIDPCCGWGARALGTMERPIRYIGFDLNQKSVQGNRDLYKFAGTSLGECSFECIDSAESWDMVEKADLVFTSPPYFDTEIYSGIPDYRPSKDLLNKIILNSALSLKKNGVLALNVPNRMEGECRLVAKDAGFDIIDYHQMATASIIRQSTSEPILVFRKK